MATPSTYGSYAPVEREDPEVGGDIESQALKKQTKREKKKKAKKKSRSLQIEEKRDDVTVWGTYTYFGPASSCAMFLCCFVNLCVPFFFFDKQPAYRTGDYIYNAETNRYIGSLAHRNAGIFREEESTGSIDYGNVCRALVASGVFALCVATLWYLFFS